MPLDGRTFASTGNTADGQVGPATRFHYREDGPVVWADYAGGDIVRGHLVGTRSGDRLDIRYVHLDRSGETASGHCLSRVEVLPDGRVRLLEYWSWESRPGSGRSTVEEPSGGDEAQAALPEPRQGGA